MIRRARGPAAAAAILLAGGAAAPARADFTSDAIGTAGSEFLALDNGARGIAMGGAFCAIADDAHAMYWNPAGLALVPRMSTVYSNTRYFADIRFHYLAHAQRLSDTGVVAAAVRYLDAGRIPQTDANGVDGPDFRPRSYVYELGYGQYVTDLADFEREIAFGVAVRLVHSDLIKHADGVAGDLGIQAHYYNTYFPYHFGLAAQNMGKGQKFDVERDIMPFRGRLGGGVQFTKNLLVTAEALFPVTNEPYGAFGAELSVEPQRNLKASLRAGLDTQTLVSDLSGFKGLTFGMGLSVFNLTIDYAFVPYGILENTHRFSIGFNLAPKTARRYRER